MQSLAKNLLALFWFRISQTVIKVKNRFFYPQNELSDLNVRLKYTIVASLTLIHAVTGLNPSTSKYSQTLLSQKGITF